MSEKYPPIPVPAGSLVSHQTTLAAMKEAIEMLTGTRGAGGNTAVRPATTDALATRLTTAEADIAALEAAIADRPLVKLADVAITNVASFDFTWTNGAYREIAASVQDYLPDNPAAGFGYAQVRVGGTWLSTAGSYLSEYIVSQGAAIASASNSGTAAGFNDTGHNAGGDYATTWLRLTPGRPSASGEATMEITTRWSGPGGRRTYRSLCAILVGNNTIDGLRIGMSGANYAADGRLLVTGVKS